MRKKKLNDFDRSISARMREFRLERGLLHKQFTAILGAADGTTWRLETGKHRWSVFQLATIAHHFGVPVTDFIPALDEEQPDRSAA